jgi:hypothetical protein
LWSFWGHIVVGTLRDHRKAEEDGMAGPRGKRRKLQEMENSGNEAKKYLKTKEVTIFTAAYFARFERILRAV